MGHPKSTEPVNAGVRIRFARDDAFLKAVRGGVKAYFEETGKSQKANAYMVLKAMFFLASIVALVTVVVTVPMHPVIYLGMFALGGFIIAQIGFNIGHDAIHGAVSKRKWVNRLSSTAFDLIGASSYTWSLAHNFLHHTFTNICGVDSDLEPGAVIRLQPFHKPYAFHRYQQVYAWFLYCFTSLVWVFKKDWVQIAKVNPRTGKKHPIKHLFGIIAGRMFHFGMFLILPLAVAPQHPVIIVIGYFIAHAVAGFCLATVFQLAHVVEGPHYVKEPESGKLDGSWAAHQLWTTANFAPRGKLSTFFSGGLNHQVEHHLFPHICHAHYPALSLIVEREAKAHGLPYYSHPTTWAALKSHYRRLKDLGVGAIDEEAMQSLPPRAVKPEPTLNAA